jgi:hypothetical protein
MYKTQAFKRLIVSFELNRKITMDVENKHVPWISHAIEVKKTVLPEIDISKVLCQRLDQCTQVSKRFCKNGKGDY